MALSRNQQRRRIRLSPSGGSGSGVGVEEVSGVEEVGEGGSGVDDEVGGNAGCILVMLRRKRKRGKDLARAAAARLCRRVGEPCSGSAGSTFRSASGWMQGNAIVIECHTTAVALLPAGQYEGVRHLWHLGEIGESAGSGCPLRVSAGQYEGVRHLWHLGEIGQSAGSGCPLRVLAKSGKVPDQAVPSE